MNTHTRTHACTHAYLPCVHVVSKIDKVLHEPVVNFIQCEALLRRLQDGLQGGKGGYQNIILEHTLTASSVDCYYTMTT